MWSLVMLVLLFGLVKPVQSQGLRAVDASFLSEMEEDGVVYRDADGNHIEDPRVWRPQADGEHVADFAWREIRAVGRRLERTFRTRKNGP